MFPTPTSWHASRRHNAIGRKGTSGKIARQVSDQPNDMAFVVPALELIPFTSFDLDGGRLAGNPRE
jgi:hypothetical protein